MAHSFNDFFVGIGNMVEGKIPKGKKHFSEFLGDSSPNTIFFKPVDKDEILGMISNSNSSKACGPNSIPSKILKAHGDSLYEPLVEIINMSLLQGTFPELLKDAEVCPIYKKNDKINANIIVLSPSSLIPASFLNALCILESTNLLKAQTNFTKNSLAFAKNTQPIMLF